jgi:threonine synthase
MDLAPRSVQETPVNEPLVNWHAFDGDLALDALRSSEGAAEFASDKDMLRMARLVRECEGLNVLPASCATLCALEKLRQQGWLDWGGPHVAVLTGRRS